VLTTLSFSVWQHLYYDTVEICEKTRQCTLIRPAFFPTKHRPKGLIESQQRCIDRSFGRLPKTPVKSPVSAPKITLPKNDSTYSKWLSPPARTGLLNFQLSQFIPKPAMFHELLNISQNTLGRHQFIAKIELNQFIDKKEFHFLDNINENRHTNTFYPIHHAA
jgi:hypothetical protein